MEISRLIFTKETKDKMNKKISKQEKGKIRFEKLKEAEEKGLLQKATSRVEVANLAGYTSEQYKTGYSWVCNMLARKHLIERISGFGKNGKVEYEYSIGSTPDYEMVNAAAGRKKAHKAKCAMEKIEKPKATNMQTKITITYGELKIELSDIPTDMIKDVIVSMFDKVKGA